MIVREKVKRLIVRDPGRTAGEIAEAILGTGARQQRVNPYCRELFVTGEVERRGKGGPGDPFRYYPKGVA